MLVLYTSHNDVIVCEADEKGKPTEDLSKYEGVDLGDYDAQVVEGAVFIESGCKATPGRIVNM